MARLARSLLPGLSLSPAASLSLGLLSLRAEFLTGLGPTRIAGD